MNLLPGTDIDGRYVVETLLGEGGMARVYRARHIQLSTLYALKVLTISSASIRERMLQEGRVQAALRHPNIVSVVDVVTVDGTLGLVMEYVSGPPLDVVLKNQGFTLTQAEVVFRGIVAGVTAAHSKGLVHRDLKPANVLIEFTDGGLIPKVTDFGLAKLLGPSDVTQRRTRSGVSMGTPGYMSPEQIRDSGKVDAQTDIFALGAILYELVCGQRAFDGKDMMELFTAVCEARYRPPRELCPKLPRRIERAIVGALQVDRDKRFQSCEELLAVLDNDDGATHTPNALTPGLWDGHTLGELKSLGAGDDTSGIFNSMSQPLQTEETWDHALPDLAGVADAELDEGVRFVPPTLEPAKIPDFATDERPSTSIDKSAVSPAPPAPAPASKLPLVALGLGGLALMGGFAMAALVVAMGLLQPPAPTPHLPDPIADRAPPVPVTAPPIAEPVVDEPIAKPAVPQPVAHVPSAQAPAPGPTPSAPRTQPAAVAVEPPPPLESPPAIAPVEVAPAAVEEAPAAVEAPAVDAPPTSAGGRLVLVGDADRVFLVGSAGQFTAGDDIPPGTYTVHAVFGGAPPVAVGEATIRAGEATRINCVSALSVCR